VMQTNSTVTKIVRSSSKAPKRGYEAVKQKSGKQGKSVPFKRSLGFQQGFTKLVICIILTVWLVVVCGLIFVFAHFIGKVW
jgi:uncharacterized membrane protein